MQSLYNLSDDQLEYQIKDRLSFMRFLDLNVHARVPDAKTVWLYRERLAQDGVMVSLFKAFDDQLRAQGYLTMGGQIVDASIIRAPRQRLNDDEKAQIKAKRGGLDMIMPYFGYKNHIASIVGLALSVVIENLTRSTAQHIRKLCSQAY